MKWPCKLIDIKFLWFRKEDPNTIKQERFITGIINTKAFSKLTLQNKVLSLGKLIVLFRSDFGFTPKALEQKIEALNLKLRDQMKKTWQTTYSK